MFVLTGPSGIQAPRAWTPIVNQSHDASWPEAAQYGKKNVTLCLERRVAQAVPRSHTARGDCTPRASKPFTHVARNNPDPYRADAPSPDRPQPQWGEDGTRGKPAAKVWHTLLPGRTPTAAGMGASKEPDLVHSYLERTGFVSPIVGAQSNVAVT